MAFQFRSPIALVVAVFPLMGMVGCTTQAQRQYQAMTTNQKATLQAYSTCMFSVRNSPAYEPIRAHIPANINNASLEQLMDTHLISDEEKTAIFAVHPGEQACRAAAMQQLAATNGSMVTIIAAAYNQADNDLIALLQRQMSWGAYVKHEKELMAALAVDLDREGNRIMAGLNQSNQAELDRRQALAVAIMQHSQNQQAIANMNRPVVTNCSRLLNTVNCVSQ